MANMKKFKRNITTEALNTDRSMDDTDEPQHGRVSTLTTDLLPILTSSNNSHLHQQIETDVVIDSRRSFKVTDNC